MMSLRFNLFFWGIVGAQIVVLLAMIGVKEATLQTGTEVVLQTVPVDPRSLLQGDYAILGYEVGEPGFAVDGIPWDQYANDRPREGEVVYVTLWDAGDVWFADGYHSSREDAGQVMIRGVIDDRGWLDFGIGTYFVPEGTGRPIERAGDVKVKAVVDQDGNAVIKEVLVDGEPFEPVRELEDRR